MCAATRRLRAKISKNLKCKPPNLKFDARYQKQSLNKACFLPHATFSLSGVSRTLHFLGARYFVQLACARPMTKGRRRNRAKKKKVVRFARTSAMHNYSHCPLSRGPSVHFSRSLSLSFSSPFLLFQPPLPFNQVHSVLTRLLLLHHPSITSFLCFPRIYPSISGLDILLFYPLYLFTFLHLHPLHS